MRDRLWDLNRLDRTRKIPDHPPELAAKTPASAGSVPLVQRKSACACGGTCPKCLEAARVQPKLAVGTPGDRFEQEADRVAKQVVRSSDAGEVAPPVLDAAGGKPQSKAAFGGGAASAAPEHGAGPAAGAPLGPSGDLPLQASGGVPLDGTERGFFEARLGRDLGDVRIHADAQAGAAARSLGALAYTVGSDIVFAEGRYEPGTAAGKELLAHELTHVLQQQAAGPLVQKQEADGQGDGTSATAAPAVTETAGVTGTVLDLQVFLMNPALEPDPGLQAAIQALGRYSSQVRVDQVEFRIMSESDRASRLATLPLESGRSFWEGNTPVIELPQSMLDTIAGHSRDGGLIHEAQEVVRTVGHEMYHLLREKEGNRGNPIQPVFAAEAGRRMEQVRNNWLDWIRNGGAAARREFGLPRGANPQRFEDLPQAAQQEIDRGAERTDFIEGLYQRTAYLVEEILVKIEELTFLRIEQRFETGARGPSRGEVSEKARQIYLLSISLENSVAAEPAVMTPALLAQARAAMLEYLRRRYPNRADSAYDSFEVIFYLAAMHGGLPPIYSGGRLISVVPEGARVPAAP